ncbi:ankyrin repeat-containing domain protein [Aspergillus pseudoustus]|uniref:Ankyrin repeat-containing domain protein n=1 Tax=Aspergillus pseudoustus TaxID=1810923 RepID=A0ABR4KGX9_9EURO
MADLILTIIEKCPSLITQKNNQGLTAFHLTVQCQQTELMQRFLELGANSMAHHAAAAMSELGKDNLDQALALGHNINARNAAGETPIMKYIYLGDPEGIRIFQDAGADLFTINNAGETLLHILAGAPMVVRLPLPWKLCQCDERKVIASFKHLMAQGLDPSLEDKRSRTAMVSIFTSLIWYEALESCADML